MSKITKISKLDNVEGFLQVDYFKGNKYIDKAGEFLDSLYVSREEAPIYSMTPKGAEIIFEKGKKRIEVNGTRLWTGYVAPDTLEIQKQFFTKVFDNAVNLFAPASYSRVGWRNHFVTEENISDTIFFKKEEWYGGDFREVYIEKSFNDIKSNIRISRVQNRDTQANGLMFDIDLYKQFKDETNSSAVKEAISNIADNFNSDEILQLINDSLKHVGK